MRSPSGTAQRLSPVTKLRAPARAATGLPILATAVPVLGAVALWVVTGSVLSLWFAALAPMMAVAGFGDRLWAARRARRRDDAVAEADSASLSAAQAPDIIWKKVSSTLASTAKGTTAIASAVVGGAPIAWQSESAWLAAI